MRADLETDRESSVGDGTRRDEIAIDDLYIAGRVLRLEVDGMGAGEGGINEGRAGARINKRKGLDRSAAGAEGDSDDDVFFWVWERDCGSVKQKPVGQSGMSGTVAEATMAETTRAR
jgi:hypothetical protein